MSLPVILRSEAEADIQEAHDHLEQVRTGLGKKFASRLREVLDQIERMPEMFGVVWTMVRAARLKKFRYVVYYVLLADHVEIVAVLHGSRDPSTWQARA